MVGAVDTQAVRVVPIILSIQEVEAEDPTMQDPIRITVLERIQDTEKSLLIYWVQ